MQIKSETRKVESHLPESDWAKGAMGSVDEERGRHCKQLFLCHGRTKVGERSDQGHKRKTRTQKPTRGVKPRDNWWTDFGKRWIDVNTKE